MPRCLHCALVAILLLSAIGLGGLLGGDPARAQAAASPRTKGNLENDVLYYIIVDRFFDANPANNLPESAFPLSPELDEPTRQYNRLNRLLLRQTYDPSHRYMGLYWGGDLEGVIRKLDYLQDLGVTKIVLSPIQDNANGLIYYPQSSHYLHQDAQSDLDQADGLYAHASAPFHGYWTKDWFEIDEHFRNTHGRDRFDVLRRLLDEAGRRGIGVILDLTLNHTSPYPEFRTPPAFEPDSIGFWFADNGSVYRHGDRVAQYWDPATQTADPQDWFHPFQPIDTSRPDKENIQKGWLPGGLPDLDHDKPAVAQYLLDAVEFWLTFNEGGEQVAGFRLDAVKHVNADFWRTLEQRVLAIDPSAVLIGEFFGGGYREPASIDWIAETEHYTQFDFDLSLAARRFFAGERHWDGRTFMLRELTLGRQGQRYNESALQRFFHWLLDPARTLDVPRRSLDRIPDREARGWVTFLENHDEPRLKTKYPHMSERAYASAIEFLFAARGVPMIMYGAETALAVPYHPDHEGLFGMGGDPFNRPMMIWPGSPGWSAKLHRTTRRMAQLRQQHPVLRYGETRFLFPERARANQDIFMVREPQSAPEELPSGDSILYAYSTHGGRFELPLAGEGIAACQNVATGDRTPIRQDTMSVELQPETSKVFVLHREET